MGKRFDPALPALLRGLVGLLVARILLTIFQSYPDYFPPNFHADFLLGREGYFWDGYHLAFYAHIVAGPCALILGTLLISDQYRRRFPKTHRDLGRVQAVCVLFVVVPSGWWMAQHAASGPVAEVGFTLLSLSTAVSMIVGWRTAVQRKFDAHRRWMSRCYLMLFSTVLVRVNGGVGSFLGIDAEWFYAHTAWTSWLVPLAIYEVQCLLRQSLRAEFVRKPGVRNAGTA